MKRTATAKWQGTGKEGKGTLSTQSGVLNDSQYGFNSRFSDGIGTNPEELIGAALAGCYSMKLAFNLQASNFTADSIETKASVNFENGSITEIQLETTVQAQDLHLDKLNELALDAKINCPISKLLNTNINLTISLL